MRIEEHSTNSTVSQRIGSETGAACPPGRHEWLVVCLSYVILATILRAYGAPFTTYRHPTINRTTHKSESRFAQVDSSVVGLVGVASPSVP